MFKKGLLSLSAIMALSTSVFGSGATYLPLTSATNDNHWMMFGVNGFKIDGATPATGANFNSAGTQLTDNGGNNVATAGLLASAGNGNLAELKALGGLGTITVNVDVHPSHIYFSPTEPVRSMYIKAGGDSNADVLFKYKASLEGSTLEFKINGASTVYTTTISASNTYDNPATRTLKGISAAVGGTPLDSLTGGGSSAVDDNLSNNPINPSNYNRSTDVQNNTNYDLRMYRYNANQGIWEIYDSGNNNSLANNFTTLTLGKAYWVKMDLNNNNLSDAVTKAGLVLGTSGLNNASYSGELASGWNLISFDGAKPNIRTSSTGMIITDKDNNGTITIADTTKNNEVNITLSDSNTVADDASSINTTIYNQQLAGNIPDSFHLRAYSSGSDKLILISNKRFFIKDDSDGDNLGFATSLDGKDLLNENNALTDYSSVDINNTYVHSVYGESALVFKPLVGAGTASHLDNNLSEGGPNASAKIQVGILPPVALADASQDQDANLSTVVQQLNDKLKAQGYNAVPINGDGIGIDKCVLLSSNKTFYIRDYTFTRVMAYNGTGAGNTFQITSPTPANIVSKSSIDDTVTAINAVADHGNDNDTGVYAAKDGSNIVFVSSVDLSNNFNIIDDTQNDYFTDSSSNNPIAQGAVAEVYSLNALAKFNSTSSPSLTPAKLTSDLKYNAIYTPDYAIDGPLYTLKDLGYTAKSIITGTTNMTSGKIAWDNLDLTQSPTEWFKNQNFNLYSIDGKSGYWVYLDNNLGTNPIYVDNVTIHPSYTYQFNQDGVTNNRVAATLQVTVHGIPADTTPVSVYVNIGGSKVELSTSGTNGIYTGSVSSYEVNGLTAGNLYGVTISVADGTGYKKDNIAIGTLDFKKPKAPIVYLGTGLNMELNSTSSDVTGYYIFDVTNIGSIPEKNTNTSPMKIAKILEANASSYNLCAKSATFGQEYTYRAIALDGNASSTGAGSDAELGFGNASDATEFTYTPTLKGAVLLRNTQGVNTGASSVATPYNTSCIASAQGVKTGISLQSIVSNATVKMSYIKKDNVKLSIDKPLTIAVGPIPHGNGVAMINYLPAYIGSKFFIEINHVVYFGTFPADDNNYSVSSNAYGVSPITAHETL